MKHQSLALTMYTILFNINGKAIESVVLDMAISNKQ